MKKNVLIVCVLLIVIGFTGCTNSNITANAEDKVNSSEETQDYETVGKIIKFSEDRVHVLTGDIASVFKVDREKIKDFYLGETVGVKKVNEFVLEKYETKDFDVRFTNMGERILEAYGEVKEVNKDKFIITSEGRDLEFESYDNISLEKGSEVLVEYLERENKNILINYYAENSKLKVVINNIKRAENSGVMILDTEDIDGTKYEVYVLAETVLNFNHSEIKKDDEITVYPEVIRESCPAQIDAKMIKK